MEDRAHHDGWTGRSVGDVLQLPSFASSAAPIKARQREYSPVLEQLGLKGDYLTSGFANGITDFQTNSSDVLRESSGTEDRVPAPPPGFTAGSSSLPLHSAHHAAFSRVTSLESSQESILGSTSNKSAWDISGRSRLASVEDLASDLGSLLNLSQSDRPDRERASTYTFGSTLSSVSNNSIYNKNNNTYINDGFASTDLNSFGY
jgi:hypothetical protein